MTKSYKDWANLDIESIEPLEVTELEKARIKQFVLGSKKKYKPSKLWRNMAAAAVILVGGTVTMGFAFPTVASQIPFMQNVITYFQDDNRYTNFEEFSTALGLAQTSNGVTVMIDHAVYDGTSITISYAIESEKDLGEQPQVRAPQWFNVKGATGMGGTGRLEKISNTRYVGLETITPHFKEGEKNPDIVQVSWEPKAFEDNSSDTVVKGDWQFDFSLEKVDGAIQLVNETTEKDGVTLNIKSIEKTDVSTVIQYEQLVEPQLLEKWPSITPVFEITDDVGNIYQDESGGGVSYNNGATFQGSTTIGAMNEKATKLILKPTTILSLNNGLGHEKLVMYPIEIPLDR